MDRRLTMRLLIAPLLGSAVLLAGCVSGVPVSVTNHSPAALTHVTVTGKGVSESIGTIAAGATETINIRPREATKVRVAFEAGGQRYTATTEAEIENDTVNTVKLTVGADMSLAIETPLR